MRTLLMLTAALACGLALAPRPATAQNYPWCYQDQGNEASGSRNCSFTSFEQCRATQQSTGGYCERNPEYRGSADERLQPAPPARRREPPVR